jgi:hypothetical protein
VLRGQVRGHQIAARRQGAEQGRDDLGRLELVRGEVQDRHQHERHRPAEVEHRPGIRVGQDRGGVAQVAVQIGGAARGRGGQQVARVSQDERVVVDVDDPGRGSDALRHLVDVVGGGQAAADVEELGDARLSRQVPDGAAEERPVLAGRDVRGGRAPQDLRRGLTVRREVVRPADEKVVDPRGMGRGAVDLRWHYWPPSPATSRCTMPRAS